MTVLRALLHALRLWWWRWALKEIDPMHPDLPQIVVRINFLENGYA